MVVYVGYKAKFYCSAVLFEWKIIVDTLIDLTSRIEKIIFLNLAV